METDKIYPPVKYTYCLDRPIDRDLVDIETACKILGCSKATFKKLCGAEGFPKVARVGRRCRMSRTGLIRWLERQFYSSAA